MEKKLPKNWVTDKLFNVVQPVGTNVKKYVGEKEYFSTGSISKEIVPEGIYDFQKKPSRANREVKLNDVLQARMKATNKSFLITENFENSLFSTGFMQFRSYGFTVLPKFIFYYLNSQEFLKAKDDLSTGATQQSINDANAKKIDFPLPPLPEQERIVAKLDLLFAQHEKMKIALEKILQLLKDFRQQILTQAVKSAKDFVKLDTFLENIKYGTSKKSDYEVDGVPVLRIPNIANGFIDSNDLKFSILDKKEYETLKLLKGDILVIRSNGSVTLVGQSALVDEEHVDYVYAGYLIRIRLKENYNSKYLNYIFKSNFIRSQMIDTSRSTSGVNNINAVEIKNILVPNLSFQEQTQIVSRVESLFSKIDAIELRYQKLKEKIDQFPQTILHKAFKGELVPQLPTDGDAKDLLKEILALKKEGKKK